MFIKLTSLAGWEEEADWKGNEGRDTDYRDMLRFLRD